MSFSANFHGPNGQHHGVSGDSAGEAGQRSTLSHNPDELASVSHIKGFTAAAMQAVINAREAAREDLQARLDAGDTPSNRESDAAAAAMRNFATALTYLEAAKMFAVNGVFARKNAGL